MHIYDRYFNYILETEDKEIIQKYRDSKYIITDTLYANPVQLEDGTIREATKEELYLKGHYNLIDGEKFQDGKIVQIPNPNTRYLAYSWNRNTFEWELSTTKEELQQTRKNLILDYSKKKEEIAILEAVEEFNTVDDVKTSKEELAKKKEEIDELTIK